MKFLSAWVMSILGVVVIGTVIDLLLTKSRVKNIIRSIFATVSILVIITPLPGIIKNGFDVNWDIIMDEVEIDGDFIDYMKRQKIKTLESAMVKAFDEDGISGLIITVDADMEDNELNVKRVTVDLSNSVIKENLSNINKYEFIRERVKTFVGKREVEVIIDG